MSKDAMLLQSLSVSCSLTLNMTPDHVFLPPSAPEHVS